MNKNNFHESDIKLNDGLRFSIIHDATKKNLEKHLFNWYLTTFDYGIKSLMNYLDLNSGHRYFTKKEFLKDKL